MSGIPILFDVVLSMAMRAVALVCLVAPVDGRVTSVFEPPACEYCAGRRSIDFETRAGEPVIAPIAGRVSFAGTVAGTRYVSITVSDRVIVTLGRLGSVVVGSGDRVGPGGVVGRAGSAPVSLSWRRDGRYLDPTPFLGRLVTRPRLVPTDGTAARPARSAECRSPRSPR